MTQSLKFGLPFLAVFMIALGMSAALGHRQPVPQHKPAALSSAEQDMQQLAVRLNEIEPE